MNIGKLEITGWKMTKHKTTLPTLMGGASMLVLASMWRIKNSDHCGIHVCVCVRASDSEQD